MTGACPKCRNVALVPLLGAKVLKCPNCKGAWLSKDQAKLEAVGALLGTDSTVRPGFNPDARTGLCPNGHGILLRARVEHDEPFFLERCPDCHGVWFDKGEWAQVAQLHLMEHLEQLWDPAFRWRSKQPEEAEALQRDLGTSTFEALHALSLALKERSPRVQAAAMAYLRQTCALDE